MKYIATTLSILCLFFGATIANAQSITLPSKINATLDTLIYVSPVVDGDDVGWDIDPGLVDALTPLPDVQTKMGFNRIFFANTAGTYTVRAWTAKVVDGKAKLSNVVTCLIVVTPVPPGPTNILKHVNIIGAEANVISLSVQNDGTIRNMCTTAKVAVHVYKASDTMPTGMATLAKTTGMPCIILQDSAGNVIVSSPITTLDAARTFIKSKMVE